MASDEAVLLTGVLPGGCAEPAYRFLSPHRAAVLDAAAHCLVPETHDAYVISYVDRLLSLFHLAPGDRNEGGPLRQRVADLQHQYIDGVALLDQLAGGDFTALPRLQQHLILSQRRLTSFTGLLFDNILEAVGFEAAKDADVRLR